VPYNDPVMGKAMGEGMANTGALLLGRRTYEDFASFWPNQPEPNPFTAMLNRGAGSSPTTVCSPISGSLTA